MDGTVFEFPGYQAQAKLHDTVNSTVYRALREADGKPVILKAPPEEYPSREVLERCRQEYEIIRSLDLACVIRAYALESWQNSVVMVLEDCGGQSLKILLAQGPLPMQEFLRIAIQITDCLGGLHAHGILHKDINPANIVYNPASGEIRLIDFSHAAILPRENPVLKSPDTLEGSLPYMSPEQTGRMNRDVDYRSDFYSLGVTFYEMLSGQLPFTADEPMELVHAHIARQPVAPAEVNAAIPLILSQLAMKLMAKTAEERYQSAWGLKADLQRCLDQLLRGGDIGVFPLGRQDAPDRLEIPRQLYGREAELAALRAAYTRVAKGAGELLILSGHPGMGKSALAQAMQKPVAQAGGYFTIGRFEQFQGSLPYFGILQAFRDLLRQILAENEARGRLWKEQLLAALGNNAQIIIDVIPELGLLLGPQPAAAALGPVEAQNRFRLAFQHFTGVFCQPSHPLLLFLDDMHWADAESIRLLGLLLADSRYLLVACSCRAPESGMSVAFARMTEELNKTGVPVLPLALPPLSLDAASQYVADALRSTPASVLPLAHVVLAKTGGNPFFMAEFLKALYVEKLLSFRPPSDHGDNGGWQWDLAQIQARNITDNVVELMAAKVQKLAPATQQALRLVACVGNRLDGQSLARILDTTLPQAETALREALAEGLISLTDSSGEEAEYRFSHDRIRQAVYSLIPAEERRELHWRVGQRLLRHAPPAEKSRLLLRIVDQLNSGLPPLPSTGLDSSASLPVPATDDAPLPSELARLNLLAGWRVKASGAYKAASGYFQTGLRLLGPSRWQLQYELSLSLALETVETAYLSGEFEVMEKFAADVLSHAHSLLETVKAHEVKIQAYSAQNQLLKAISTALAVLRLLGTDLPEQPQRWHRARGWLELKLALRGRDIEDLLDLPFMSDPYKLATVRILSSVSYAAYRARPALMPLIIYKLLSLSVKHGNTPVACYAYATCGQQLCAAGDALAGYRFGTLALNLLQRLDTKEVHAKTGFIVHGYTRYWQEPLKDTLQPLQTAYQTGLETGDLGFAANAAFLYCVHSYFLGRDLRVGEQETAMYSDAIHQLKQKAAFNSINLYRQIVHNLLGLSSGAATELNGPHYYQDKMLPAHQAANDRTAIFQLSLNKLILCYLFQNYGEAIKYMNSAEKHLDATLGSMPSTAFHFYSALARLAACATASPAERRQLLRKAAASQSKLKEWASHAPVNFLHKYWLVEAERLRVLECCQQARECYDKAIALAHNHGYLQEEALAHELAAQFYQEQHLPAFAGLCFHNAHYAYNRWGAQAKVKQLVEKYPRFLAVTDLGSGALITTTTHSSSLDLASVLKASQTIAGEIVLSRLLAKLMSVVVENAGAQRGFLLLEQNGEWQLESAYPPPDAVALPEPVEGGAEAGFSTAIIHYVARTRESLVLRDATREGKFTRDPYILQNRPKSILATPLLNQGQITAILYLENNLATGAFTPERLEILNLLSAQMAISLENARLYSGLEAKVEERTRELHEKNEALVRLNQDKNEFLGIAAHDLKNPLSAIRGLAEEIQESLDDMPPEEILEYAGMIHKAAQKMFQLITNLLDVNAIESGKMNITLADVDILPIVRGLAHDYAGRASAKNIQVNFQAEAAAYVAHVDENTVHQVMDNLISNAVKYSPHEKSIWIRLRRNGDYIRCEIKDEGPGMTAADKEKLFGKFNRLSAQPTGGEHSTGLGLFIVKKLIDAMHSRVWCESEVGKGAMFVVEFPAAG
jgi:predicted ATPase/signal transduction histidine kinase